MSARLLPESPPVRWANLAGLAVAPFLGLGAMVLPVAGDTTDTAGLFGLVDHALNGFGGGAALLLVFVGAILGAVSSTPAWALGLAGIAFLPLISVAEMLADPTSNNLGPIAWLFYVFEWGPLFLGAELVQRARRGRSRVPENHA